MKNNSIKDSILLIDTTAETNRQLHAALGGVIELIYTTSSSKDIDDILKQSLPKIIIFEIFDAGKTGFNKCRDVAFKESARDIPVVAIISSREVDFMSTGYYMGASDYMIKPLIPAEVLARIGGQLELATSHRAIKDISQHSDGTPQHLNNQTSHELKQAKILVVDDCIDSLEPLILSLNNLYQVHSANNGTDAIALAQQHQFDLILLDVMMPDMTGYDVCRKLKENNNTTDTPIIFLTGQSDSSFETLGLTLGAVDYILKPASLSVVLARVRAHLLNTLQQKKLTQLTYLDHLTQIPNRRCLNERLTLEHKRALRSAKPLSILLVDIDHFKQYNDHYGHVEGDQCLKRVAKALQTCQRRPSDIISRFGGEEFVAVLPDTDEDGALHVATNMQKVIKDLNLAQSPQAKESMVTVSIGVATMLTGKAQSTAQLLDEADKMLYRAKKQGRNKIYSPTSETVEEFI